MLSFRAMNEKSDIYRIKKDDREIILIGTAHISQASKDLVRATIEAESPDTVCVELDEGRLNSIKDPDRWKKTDLKKPATSGSMIISSL